MSSSSRRLTQMPYNELYDHAYGLVNDLVAAFELLAEHEQSVIRDRLVRMLRLKPQAPPAAPRRSSNRADLRQRNRPHRSRPMSRCPHCTGLVRTDRLEQHIENVHLNPKSGPPRRAKSRPKKIRMVLCGDCDKEMTRTEYRVHLCRPSRRIPFVSGGGPGLGRRR